MTVTNLRVVCKIITCVSAFTEMAIIFLEIVKAAARSGHSEVQAMRRMSLWALAIALTMGKNTRLFGMLDQNETQLFTNVSQRAVQGSHCRDERLAWVASRWPSSSSFVSKVLGANCESANNFHPVADIFAMYTDRK